MSEGGRGRGERERGVEREGEFMGRGGERRGEDFQPTFLVLHVPEIGCC